MSLRLLLDALPAEKWRNEKVYFKKIQSEDDLIYAGFDCKLRDNQMDLVNPAWFSIGRAYIAPDDNYPCIICSSNGKNIGFINRNRHDRNHACSKKFAFYCLRPPSILYRFLFIQNE